MQTRTRAQCRLVDCQKYSGSLVPGLRRAQARALGIAWAPASAAARTLAFVAALAVGLVGCFFDSSPHGSPATLERDDGGTLWQLGAGGRSSSGKPYRDDAGGLLELPDLADAGDDAGELLEQPDAAGSAGSSGSSGAGGMVAAGAGGAGPTEPPDGGAVPADDAAAPVVPELCQERCSDGTTKCPSSSSSSGFVCRSWPPCYCTPDAGGS